MSLLFTNKKVFLKRILAKNKSKCPCYNDQLSDNEFTFIPIKILLKFCLLKGQSSDSQTFSVGGPLKIFQCSSKHKILICIAIHGPLALISRTTSGPQSRLWESLHFILHQKYITIKITNLKQISTRGAYYINECSQNCN